MTNKQIAAFFAAGATSARGSNFYIEGDRLYSYGPHFVVAERHPDGIYVTERKFSRSTSRHVSLARSAAAQAGKLAGTL